MAKEVVELQDEQPRGLFIPAGVAHGFISLTDVVLTYLVDNYYDGTDENGVAWNDPEIGLDWGEQLPMLSDRDAKSPLLTDIPKDQLPK